ncbi:predicted protein [Uncinocarpus reesii 1704]|uniref:J domain-containing protein n=1 Tax=Uncinocarpus reesii (strain UAMH 1704) TaxID=336963 RepID=C4JZ31_UNCRE|nr:uncharacterized protein UREG_07432 [Uncinocarpus reesii 1704]EEP82567.1 predicted protein [Uncinocarpus reesii 1704]
MFKKPSLLCSCCGGFQLLNPQSSVSPHSTASSRRRIRLFESPRRFAHVQNTNSIGPGDDFSWPTSPNFSPYEVFKQDQSAPYSKQRFYELVKLYHPDRPCNGHPLCKDLPESLRMHRYRIIVAAHELLSDPVKRAAYDKYKDGWHHRHELFGIHAKQDFRQSAVREAYPGARKPGDEIFRNATWEDWQQYYDKRDGRPKQAQTVSHSTFASFLLLLALFGGVGQAITVGKYSSFVQDRVKDVDSKCGKFLDSRRQNNKEQMNSRDARIQKFLMDRDPSGYGLKEDEEETYRRLLGAHRTTDVMNNIDSMREKRG